MSGLLNERNSYSQNMENSSYISSTLNDTWINTVSSIVNDTAGTSTICPNVVDTIQAAPKWSFLAFLVVPFHLANIISIATNRRLHQNGYFLLLNLSVGDLLVNIISLFLYTSGVPGKNTSLSRFLAVILNCLLK